MLDAADRARTGKELDILMFGGAVSWGSHIRSMVVASRYPEPSTAVCSDWLLLADLDRPASEPGCYYLKADSPAVQELTFHAWLAAQQYVQLQKRVGSIPQQLWAMPDVELVIQPATGNGSSPNQPLRVHATSFNRGICTGIVTSSGNNERVLVKVGHEAGLQALALHLGFAWESLYQVDYQVYLWLAMPCKLVQACNRSV